MTRKVFIAHADGEEHIAERLAEPLRGHGYSVAHKGTFIVGDSFYTEVAKLLAAGVPVVFCGTARAAGTMAAKHVVNAARTTNATVPVFVLQMEKDADVHSIALGSIIGRYWQDPTSALDELVLALNTFYRTTFPPRRAPAAPYLDPCARC